MQYNQIKVSTNIVKDVGKLLVNVRILIFLAWCVVVGMCTGLMWNFFLWMVEDLGEARNDARIQTLKGVLMGVQCLGGELPFFFLSGKILKVIGHVNAMTLVLFTLGVRFLLYSVIDDPWWFIPIEFSNGLTYGVCYACMASYASIIAPSGTEATMQVSGGWLVSDTPTIVIGLYRVWWGRSLKEWACLWGVYWAVKP